MADAGAFAELNELYAEFFPAEASADDDAGAAAARTADLDWVHSAERGLTNGPVTALGRGVVRQLAQPED